MISLAQLVMDRGKRKKLKDKFQLSDSAISEAIHFKSNGKLARSVRSYAVNVLNAYPVLS